MTALHIYKDNIAVNDKTLDFLNQKTPIRARIVKSFNHSITGGNK